jgi:hypothetical protein
VPVVKGMPEVTWLAGEDWFAAQDEAVQASILGPAKLADWRDGRLNFKDLAKHSVDPVWGHQLREAPLRDIVGDLDPGFKDEQDITDSNGFPTVDRLGELEEVRSLGGSTGAKLVRDPKTGEHYVMKRGKDAGHLREEVLADGLYKKMGANVPDFMLYEDADGGPVKLSKYIDDTRTLRDVMRNGSAAEIAAVRAQLQKHFAADALLANWDVIGLEMDNILVDGDGQVWRVDNGSSLRRRAQGAVKDFDEYPMELWTMRDPKMAAEAAKIFGDVDYYDLIDQIEDIVRHKKALVEMMPDDLRGVFEKRMSNFADVGAIGRIFKDDGWISSYTDGFTYQSMNLRKTGTTSGLPAKLTHKGVVVYDEDGTRFDNLRGPDSATADIKRYIEGEGGDWRMLSRWMGAQGGSSWSRESQAIKYYYAQNMGGNTGDYWWKDVPGAKRNYEMLISKFGREKVDQTWQAWHAWNYEMMRSVDFPKNDRGLGLIELIRTESADVMRAHGIKPGDKNVVIPRGSAESFSIYQRVRVYGSELTRQQVPHHRIIGTYFQEREPGSGYSVFLGDGENEFVVLPKGIPFDYVSR